MASGPQLSLEDLPSWFGLLYFSVVLESVFGS